MARAKRMAGFLVSWLPANLLRGSHHGRLLLALLLAAGGLGVEASVPRAWADTPAPTDTPTLETPEPTETAATEPTETAAPESTKTPTQGASTPTATSTPGTPAPTGTPAPALGAELLSVNNIRGVSGNAISNEVSTNGAGTIDAFYSDASDLVLGDTNQARDVFVRNRLTGTTERVSVSTSGEQANEPSQAAGGAPAINGCGDGVPCGAATDGEFVAFYSDASNLVEGDTNGQSDIFVRDRTAGTTERICNSAQANANGPSIDPSISGDGRLVAFTSRASNLVDGDTNHASDIFVCDRVSGTIQRACGSVQGNGDSFSPNISADGRFVVFASSATNLVPTDTNGRTSDIFVCDLETGNIDTLPASVSTAGVQGDKNSILPAVCAHGRVVVFKSEADNLVPNDHNGVVDVFARDRCVESGEPVPSCTPSTERISVNPSGQDANDASFPPSISWDCRFVAFGSSATNLVGGSNFVAHVYVRDRLTGETRLVDINRRGVEANGGPPDVAVSISGNGLQIGYPSGATNLVTNDFNGVPDVFITLRPGCGNGVLEPGEQCDDGNLLNGDCCNELCQPEPENNPCPDEGNACTLNLCNATGICTHPAGNAGAVCRSAAGECDVAETCSGTSPDCPADVKKPAGTACTDDGNACTLDQCDGSSAACQHPAGNPGTVCRTAAGECDVAETCTGTSPTCPPDVLKPASTVCRTAAGDCDIAETCDGTSPACPADVKKPSGTVCRTAAGECDVAETCDGTAATCPADTFKPSSTVCRTAAGECDIAETCSGTSGACPADTLKPPGSPCTDDGNACTLDQCNGTSLVCMHTSQPAGTVCRTAAGECDIAETCDGTAAPCPADLKKPSGTVCRTAAGDCDVAETCDGTAAACPADTFKPPGTSCNDNNPCTVNDTCQGITCTGTPKSCGDDVFCNGVETCDPTTGDCVSPGNPCVAPNPKCNETTKQCVASEDSDACNCSVVPPSQRSYAKPFFALGLPLALLLWRRRSRR